MAKQIYVNLPVKDIVRTNAFFSQLGYTFNPNFSDDKATCMIITEDIFVMLLQEEFFKGFTNKEIPDTQKTSEVIVSFSAESRAAVDELIHKAVAAGATTPNEPQDMGFMYQHGFQDLDGHLWEYLYMDESALPPQNL
ncbi:VOC family protein [Chitinophaga niabensis]|uniref:Glyoxalase/Bleomycin resistance-like N-terminal domain-containing protein n=1 Tax=Chitinophaga niabensis TaxID=536979 RepID=A0A1N6F5U8_9BACT|nr:VOC family protein [Chitinophaga niabensis]SIN90619.1 hypothetical protein SAMN04488055_2034 [Chitinophaga niabensis]